MIGTKQVFDRVKRMEVAIAEPYFHGIHGGDKSIPHYITVYSYDLEEFYGNYWQDELKVAVRNIRRVAHQLPYQHDLIRGYKFNIGQHVRLHLVQIYNDELNRELCILHTYKLNILKRLWRKKRELRLRQL